MDRITKTLRWLDAVFLNPSDEQLQRVQTQLIDQYQSHNDDFYHDFHRITLDELPQTSEELLQSILIASGVPRQQHGRYLHQKITVYEWLSELNAMDVRDDERHQALSEIIRSINRINQIRWKALIAWILSLSACSVLPIWIYGLFTVIESFVTASSVVAAGGLGYSIAVLLYTLYQHHYSEATPGDTWLTWLQNNGFALTNTAFVASAWTLLLTATASNPIISALFVAGEMVHVIKEIATLVHIVYFKQISTPDDNDKLGQQQYVRALADFERRKHDAIVQLAAAVLMTLVIAAWCFIPGGFVVPLVCIIAIGLIKGTTWWATSQNKATAATQIAEQFLVLESEANVPINRLRSCTESMIHQHDFHQTSLSSMKRSNSMPHFFKLNSPANDALNDASSKLSNDLTIGIGRR